MTLRCGKRPLGHDLPDDAPSQFEIDVLQISADGPASAYRVFVNNREAGFLQQEFDEKESRVRFLNDDWKELDRVVTEIQPHGEAWYRAARADVTEMLRKRWPYAHINWYTRR